ncbi:hypothetical protein [Nocardia sp. NPDC047038]|uniref:hypothetical protein n=1 Tax=Nocardia sp. NPDC047038 TaxID=3154338 RepID=UPI0033FAC247
MTAATVVEHLQVFKDRVCQPFGLALVASLRTVLMAMKRAEDAAAVTTELPVLSAAGM